MPNPIGRDHASRGRAPIALHVLPVLLVLVVLLAVIVAACGGGARGIRTSDPWARNSPRTAGAGAAYVVIDNAGSAADALVGARSDVSASAEVHETYEVEPSMPAGSMPSASMGMGGDTGSPMLGMRRVERIEIAAGGRLELKPGSYHIMLIDLNRELAVGDSVEITLVFEQAGEVRITAVVREG